MKILAASAIALLVAAPAFADEPDGLKLPAGFHASVVADGLTGMRHLAVRGNGDIYISTRAARGQPSLGIIALHLGADGKADKIEHFAATANVDGGTGIRFYKNALYATSVTGVYRFDFSGDALTPAAPVVVMDGIPAGGQTNRVLAFDGKGGMYLSVSGSGNICADAVPATAPKDTKPVGLTPCPGLKDRGGIWRFDVGKTGLKFPAGGTRIVTGLRDMDAMDYRMGDGLYGIMHDRNGTSTTWPNLVSAADDDNIAEEMHKMTKGVDLGWPTTYYDGMRNARLTAPEYGGDGKTVVKPGTYDAPVLAFTGHSAPLDMVFYTAKQFPAAYRGGAFVAMHGGQGAPTASGRNGFDIVYVQFDRAGHTSGWSIFADGFAGPTSAAKSVTTATYRPVGVAIAPDGGLYVADSQKGKLWKISYSGK